MKTFEVDKVVTSISYNMRYGIGGHGTVCGLLEIGRTIEIRTNTLMPSEQESVVWHRTAQDEMISDSRKESRCKTQCDDSSDGTIASMVAYELRSENRSRVCVHSQIEKRRRVFSFPA